MRNQLQEQTFEELLRSSLVFPSLAVVGLVLTMPFIMLLSCAAPSYAQKYAFSRGVGDVGSTAYLDAIGDHVIKRNLIANFSNQVVAWIDANRHNISDNEFFRDELKRIVPLEFHFLVDKIAGKFGIVPAHNVELAWNFFTGVRTGAMIYERWADDPHFQVVQPESHDDGVRNAVTEMSTQRL